MPDAIPPAPYAHLFAPPPRDLAIIQLAIAKLEPDASRGQALLATLVATPGTFRIVADGDRWMAMTGPDLERGLGASADTPHAALERYIELARGAVLYGDGQVAKLGDVVLGMAGGMAFPQTGVVVGLEPGHDEPLGIDVLAPFVVDPSCMATTAGRPEVAPVMGFEGLGLVDPISPEGGPFERCSPPGDRPDGSRWLITRVCSTMVQTDRGTHPRVFVVYPRMYWGAGSRFHRLATLDHYDPLVTSPEWAVSMLARGLGA